MSVYIPGMEMPTSCKDCKAFVCYRQYAGDSGDCFCGITKSDAKVVVRNADCPLVPVPPHGDLIERKAVCLTDFEIAMCDGDYKEGMKMLLEKTESAPTIIPASGGTDNE